MCQGALISSYTRGEQNESHLQLAVFLLKLMHNGACSLFMDFATKLPNVAFESLNCIMKSVDIILDTLFAKQNEVLILLE